MSKQWFDVDKAGLGLQAGQQPKGRLIAELVQNALDEAGVTRIEVDLERYTSGSKLVQIVVRDDAPEGFRDIAHAYTLFAKSYKRDNPEKRGQFNLGEKLVLALCYYAKISTTKGTVLFDHDVGRLEKPRQCRPAGSEFLGLMPMTNLELEEALTYLRTLLIPTGVEVLVNLVALQPRQPVCTFAASLETMMPDGEGVMRSRQRSTTIAVYEPLENEVASIYELGLPVVETGDRWHIDIGQRVPLNRDRDNVKPSFLKAVRSLVLNQMQQHLTAVDANALWVRQGSADARCSDEAINTVLDLRFGEKRAAYDPTDPEANKAFVAQGGTLVYGGMLDGQEWANAKRAQAIEPAGRICPTAKPYSSDPDAPLVDIVPVCDWTPGMAATVAYAKMLARELMGVSVGVTIVNTHNNFLACYGGQQLDFNVMRLGKAWFDQLGSPEMDTLILHEFGHQYSGDHLSEAYHQALCRLGARLKKLALDKPELFRPQSVAVAAAVS